ncbi:tetratricopeptide repeat protein [Tautonia plasticadhaerens]|uniref:Tetratricopeptide repeat protein n=1 Tax=Tautonia plasticadhaerens TaxID=2527974 RepID=A0A518GZJ4_9BACT|nr:tetratricopeptide repeat protein [Tautonia plasticadhaerens]QDV33991.1 hypothetical protein ElP_18720 [Tautonia plasticadhaerens]
MLERLAEDAPNRVDYARQRSQIQGLLNVALLRLGRPEEAAPVGQAELELTRSLAGRYPEDHALQHDYAVVLVNRGAMHGMRGDHERAAGLFGQAEPIARRLSNVEGGTVRDRLLLGNVLTMQAASLHELGRDEDCLPLLDEAARIWEALRSNSPGDRTDRYLISNSYMLEAIVGLALGLPGRAAEAARRRRALWDGEDPGQFVAVAADLSRSASMAESAEGPRPASARHREALDALDALGKAVSLGYRGRRRLATDPAFDAIRPLPGFDALFDPGFPSDPFARGPDPAAGGGAGGRGSFKGSR